MNDATHDVTPAAQNGVVALARHAARRLMLDRQARFRGATFGLPMAGRPTGRVVSVRYETPDTKTFELKPDSTWAGHKAGQFTMVSTEVDGVTLERCYSISSAPSERTITLTVKRVPGGRVSGVLHDRIEVGDVLRLEQASGAFSLPESVPEKLLFLAGGSGITPVLSILHDLASRAPDADVVLLSYARSEFDAIGVAALSALEPMMPGLRTLQLYDDDGERARGYDEAELRRLVPDFSERHTMLCGPQGMMDSVRRTWATEGLGTRLSWEAFGSAPGSLADRADDVEVEITLARSGRTVTVSTGRTLLEGLEAAGEMPRYGCRMGICRSCRCKKVAGVVEDIRSETLLDAANEDVALCVTTARTNVELDL